MANSKMNNLCCDFCHKPFEPYPPGPMAPEDFKPNHFTVKIDGRWRRLCPLHYQYYANMQRIANKGEDLKP